MTSRERSFLCMGANVTAAAVSFVAGLWLSLAFNLAAIALWIVFLKVTE